MKVQFTCAHCSELMAVGRDSIIDSGTVFVCLACKRETIIDLFKPEERRKLYGAWTKRD